MYRDNREYRNMPMVEVRKEDSSESSFLVEGYATNLGIAFQVRDDTTT